MNIPRAVRTIRSHRGAHTRRNPGLPARRDADRTDILWTTGVWPVMWL